MLRILLPSMLIIAIAVLLLCIKLAAKKNGEFSSMHIHDSKAMKDRGIYCVMDQDKTARDNNKAC